MSKEKVKQYDLAGMWRQYRTWIEKAAKDRDIQIAAARKAASAMQREAVNASVSDSDVAAQILADRISAIDADYDDEIKKIEASEAYRWLNELYQWERQHAIKTTTQYFRRTADMTQRERRRYGRLNRGEGFDSNFGKVPDNRGDAYDPMRGQPIDNRGGAWDPNLADNPDVVAKTTSVDTFDYQTYGKTFESWGDAKSQMLAAITAETEE